MNEKRLPANAINKEYRNMVTVKIITNELQLQVKTATTVHRFSVA